MKTLVTLFLSLLCGFSQVWAIAPQPMMPQLSPAQYQDMMAEVDNYLSKMSEEEINNMVQEAMKDPGFQKFVEEVETGKIKLEDLYGAPPQAPPAPKADAKTPTPSTLPTPPAEKPILAPLRSKAVAMETVQALIKSIGDLRIKTTAYHKVADALKPWNKTLDSFTYYLRAMLSQDKTDHIEHLISDKNFLPLHDALKRLSDELRTWEPKVSTPEFGERELPRDEKEQSKVALQKILSLFQNAFEMQQIIGGLEQLFAKYEPEILRRRKIVEENEARAAKEAEQAKSIRPSPARVERESRYIRPASTFYDWYYEVPESPSYGPSMGYEPEAHSRSGGDFNRSQANSSEANKFSRPAEKKDDKDKDDKKGPRKAAPLELPPNVEPGLIEIERAAKLVGEELLDTFEETFRGGFGAFVPSYLGAPASLTPRNLANERLFLARAGTVNQALGDITNALEVMQKRKPDVEYEIKKMDKGAAKERANKRLNEAVARNRVALQRVYDATLTIPERVIAGDIGNRVVPAVAGVPAAPAGAGQPLSNWLQLVANYGVPNDDIFHAPANLPSVNSIGRFQEAFELLYGVNRQARMANDAAMRQEINTQIEAAAPAGGARRRPAAVPGGAGAIPGPDADEDEDEAPRRPPLGRRRSF
jgi:hypothetical protein